MHRIEREAAVSHILNKLGIARVRNSFVAGFMRQMANNPDYPIADALCDLINILESHVEMLQQKMALLDDRNFKMTLPTIPPDVAASAGLIRQPLLHSSEPFNDGHYWVDGVCTHCRESLTSIHNVLCAYRNGVPGADPAHDPGENYADAGTGKPLTVGEMLRAGNETMGTPDRNFASAKAKREDDNDDFHIDHDPLADAPTFLPK